MGSIEIAPLTYFAILSTLLLARSVRFGSGLPSSFEVDEEADAAVLPQGEALKKLMRKSGRYQKLDDPKGIWGYESYCVDGVVSLEPPPPLLLVANEKPTSLSLSLSFSSVRVLHSGPQVPGRVQKVLPGRWSRPVFVRARFVR